MEGKIMTTPESFQARVAPWMEQCLGPEISADVVARNHRFLEEALELVQACGCTRSEAHQMVDYVFDKPIGHKPQEVGGVMVTLAALCLAHGIDMHEAGDAELTRVWGLLTEIKARHDAKPKFTPPTDAELWRMVEAFCARYPNYPWIEQHSALFERFIAERKPLEGDDHKRVKYGALRLAHHALLPAEDREALHALAELTDRVSAERND